MVRNPPANAEDVAFPGLGRPPCRRKWQPTPVFLPGKSHGQKNLVGYSSWDCKESDTTERLTLSPHFLGSLQILTPVITKLLNCLCVCFLRGVPGGSDDKESTCQCRRFEFNPWIRKIPRRREWHPLEYSCLENPMDRGAWRAIVHGAAKSPTQLDD